MTTIISEQKCESGGVAESPPSAYRMAHLLCMLGLVCLACILFALSVEIRKPWFGSMSTSNSGLDLLSSPIAVFANNWFREGPLTHGLALYAFPYAPDCVTPESRVEYAGYPPGFVVPLYLMARILNSEILPIHVTWFCLFCQLWIAVFLSLTVFSLLSFLKQRPLVSFLYALIPLSLFLFLPATFFFYQALYWAEQAVLVPYSLFLFLEAERIRKAPRYSTLMTWLQLLVLIWGVFTEWLFILLACALLVTRLLDPERLTRKRVLRHTLWIMVPIAVLMTAFVGRALAAGVLWYPITRFLEYAGAGGAGPPWRVLTMLLTTSYGAVAMQVFWISAAMGVAICLVYAVARVRKMRVTLEFYAVFTVLFLLLAPTLGHVTILRAHTSQHLHSSVKFGLVLATVPFALLPALLAYACQRRWPHGLHVSGRGVKNITLVLPLLMNILAACLISSAMEPGIRQFRSEPSYAYQTMGRYLRQHLERRDVVFARGAEYLLNIGEMGYVMKRLNPYASLYDMMERVKDCKEDYVVTLLRLPQAIQSELGPRFAGAPDLPGMEGFGISEFIKESSAQVDRSTGIRLYKMPPTDFLKLCTRLDVVPWRQRKGCANAIVNEGFEFADEHTIKQWTIRPETIMGRIADDAPCPSPECRALEMRNTADTVTLSQHVNGLAANGCYRALGYVAVEDSFPCRLWLEVRDNDAALASSSPSLLSTTFPEGLWLAADFRVPPARNSVTFSLVASNTPWPESERQIACCCFQVLPLSPDSMAAGQASPAEPR